MARFITATKDVLKRKGIIVKGHFVNESKSKNVKIWDEPHIKWRLDQSTLIFQPEVANGVVRQFRNTIDTLNIGGDIDAFITPNGDRNTLINRMEKRFKRTPTFRAEESMSEDSVLGRILTNFLVCDLGGRAKVAIIAHEIAPNGSFEMIIQELRSLNIDVEIFVFAIFNCYGATAAQLGVECLNCIAEEKRGIYLPCNCKMCKDGVPVNTDHGNGAKWVEYVTADKNTFD